MAFDTLISYFRKFLGVKFRHMLNNSLVGVPRKIVLLKLENIKRDGWYSWW